MLEPTMGTPNAAAGTFKPAASAPSIGSAPKNLSPKQFSGAGNASLNMVRGAAAGGIAGAARGAMGGPVGMAVGAAGGAALSTPAGRTAIGNVGNVASGAARGAVSGAKSGFKVAGPIGGLVGGEAGAIRGAAASPAGHNILHGIGTGITNGFKAAGPLGALPGAIIGGIGGLFHSRSAAPSGPQVNKTPGASVPDRSGGAYTVKKGDTLTSIAGANNTTVDALRKANPAFTAPGSKYKNGNMIWSGTKVNLK